MALAGVKLDSESGGFVSNCFPVRGLLKRDINEGDGAWLVAHRAEQRRRFKAVLCAKPRTYSRIREERKRTEDHGLRLTTGQFNTEEEEEEGVDAVPVLDGYFLMKHCCVEDPTDLCSVNIAGLELTEVKEDDFEMFDNVAYVNAGENYLPFEAFRGFPSLRELEVPFNGLRNLKIEMNSFPHLEVLDLSYNNLCQEDVLTVGQLACLRVLHLTGNSLKSLPPDMALPYLRTQGSRKVHRPRFAKLEVLLLDDNNLSDISVFAALAGLPKLRHINMEKNAVYCIPQLKCVEGRVVTQDGSKKRRPRSGRKSGRRPKSRQSDTHKEEHEDQTGGVQVTTGSAAGSHPQTAETEAADNSRDAADAAVDKANKKEEDISLDELLTEDFSLGDLTDRITELEEEAAKVMEPEDPGTSKDMPLEDYVPKILPPFPELRYLNLAHNQIQDEDALLAVAAWPMLVQLVIYNNPLTQHHQGDPPLLKRFLSDRLGIRLQRKDEPRLVKPHIEIEQSKSRTVVETVPKVPRSTIEERLQQLALEAPKTAQHQQAGLESQPSKSFMLSEDRTLSGLDLETSKRMPLPPIQAPHHQASKARAHAWLEEEMAKDDDLDLREVEEEQDGGRKGAEAGPEQDAFFMTQVDDPGEGQGTKPKQQQRPGEGGESSQKKQHKKKKSSSPAADNNNCSRAQRYKGFELLLEDDDDVEMEVELPRDIQGNVRALKHALNHTLVYRDPSVDLDSIKRSVREFRRAPVPPAKPHKPRHERVDEVLSNLRTRTTVDEESLSAVLKDTGALSKKFPEAQNMLAQIQRRYNSVRNVNEVFTNADLVYDHCRVYMEKKCLPPTEKKEEEEEEAGKDKHGVKHPHESTNLKTSIKASAAEASPSTSAGGVKAKQTLPAQVKGKSSSGEKKEGSSNDPDQEKLSSRVKKRRVSSKAKEKESSTLKPCLSLTKTVKKKTSFTTMASTSNTGKGGLEIRSGSKVSISLKETGSPLGKCKEPLESSSLSSSTFNRKTLEKQLSQSCQLVATTKITDQIKLTSALEEAATGPQDPDMVFSNVMEYLKNRHTSSSSCSASNMSVDHLSSATLRPSATNTCEVELKAAHGQTKFDDSAAPQK